jgi:hypothetical protein
MCFNYVLWPRVRRYGRLCSVCVKIECSGVCSVAMREV